MNTSGTMNCARARFLLYAYFDRELSSAESEALTRHLAGCPPCGTRADSARGLARLLRSRLDRSPAPVRLRERLHRGMHPPVVRTRYPAFVAAAGLALLILPLSSDVRPRIGNPPGLSAASLLPAASIAAVAGRPLSYVSKRVSGTFVCILCETRTETGLCTPPEPRHEPAFCAENGEIWRLMTVSSELAQDAGRTATVEGIAFPQSGFLRANRVGY
ncbi:MAG: zf-HC2 domain-containing protein [Thermoanaerobaculia bacterium]|nr:zf-HC2 domain-containing protein [Thermoanaerobaculia bacterium]